MLAIHEKYFLQSRYMKTLLNKFSYINKKTLHTPLMKFWKQDIQVLYLLRLNPSNNSPNDFEQYSALKNGPFHYIMKVDFWRKK